MLGSRLRGRFAQPALRRARSDAPRRVADGAAGPRQAWLAFGAATAAGVTLASTAANAEGAAPAAADYPPFSLTEERYDQTTYYGRYRRMTEATDPRTLLIGDDELAASVQLLERFASGELPAGGVSDADLWNARRIKEAIVHPQTGEPIFPLVRFSAFALANIPMCVWLMWPGASAANAMASQWANQSYNVAVNYGNRNMSNPMPTETVVAAYTLAVGTSCAIAVGLGKVMKSPRMASFGILAKLVPWTAVCAAGCANVIFVRWNEMSGIAVTDASGETELGQSAAAGTSAVLKCCAARVIWTTPVLMGVPLVMAPLEKTAMLKGSPRLRMATELAVVVGLLFAVVPASLAVFPQRDSLAVGDVEPEIQAKARELGVERVYYNKGL